MTDDRCFSHSATTTANTATTTSVAAINNKEAPPMPPEKDIVEKMMVHFMIGFRQICIITAFMPLITLLLCFIFAVVYQAEEVHETHCRVFNIIPSISAITGISPQRYFWRICIALHIGPRFVIAACYRSRYIYLLRKTDNRDVRETGLSLITLVFWLHIVEITALCGVTYVSNRENYPLHEKIFIIFMTCSLCHMLATIKLCGLLTPNDALTDKDEISLRWKKRFFAISMLSTIGLLWFFFKHRFYCQDLAFSWFALCEYIIACANMAFHCTTMLDFPTENFFIAKGINFKRIGGRISIESWKFE